MGDLGMTVADIRMEKESDDNVAEIGVPLPDLNVDPNITLGPVENVLELVVPDLNNNDPYLPPVNELAMMHVSEERAMLYGANPNQELQLGSGYNFHNPSAVFLHNQENEILHTQIEMNAQALATGFETTRGGVLQPNSNEVGVTGSELAPQYQNEQDMLFDSNILSPFNDLTFDSSTFYSGFDCYCFDDDLALFGA